MYGQYDTVNIMIPNLWEVPEKMWHRNTLFEALIFSESNVKQQPTGSVLNALAFASDRVTLNADKGKTANALKFADTSFNLNDLSMSTILQSLIFNNADVGLTYNSITPSINVLNLNQAAVDFNTSFVPRYSLNTVIFNIDTSSRLKSSSKSATTFESSKFKIEVRSKAVGKISWIKIEQTTLSKSYTLNDSVYGLPVTSSENSQQYLRGNS
tara:strand:+ start:1120 stop:1755 length:636 start_codon:yes stop_codon:yes gene_type:complete